MVSGPSIWCPLHPFPFTHIIFLSFSFHAFFAFMFRHLTPFFLLRAQQSFARATVRPLACTRTLTTQASGCPGLDIEAWFTGCPCALAFPVIATTHTYRNAYGFGAVCHTPAWVKNLRRRKAETTHWQLLPTYRFSKAGTPG